MRGVSRLKYSRTASRECTLLVLLISNLAFARFICRRQRSQRDQFRHIRILNFFASKKRDFASSPTWCNLNHARLPIPPYPHINFFASKKRDFASSPTWCNLNHARCVPLEIQSYRVALKRFLVLLISNLAFARFICRRQRSQRDQFRYTCVFSHIFTRLRVAEAERFA